MVLYATRDCYYLLAQPQDGKGIICRDGIGWVWLLKNYTREVGLKFPGVFIQAIVRCEKAVASPLIGRIATLRAYNGKSVTCFHRQCRGPIDRALSIFRSLAVRMPLFRGVKRWGKLISALLLSSLFLAACGENSPSVLNPAGPVADRERILFWFILIVATIVFVAVEGMLIYSIFRFRERPNSPTPRQIHGNNTIEIIWTVA